MHIPDGYLDMSIALIFYVLSIGVIAYSARKLKNENIEDKIPAAGMVAAAIFAAQMLNWPIPGGTSAHLVGGAIAAILLGPYMATIAMASVITIQCLLFGDGGITALGANIWNMGVVDVYVSYFIFRKLSRVNKKASLFISGWLGITAGAIFAGIETGFSSSFHYDIFTTVTVMGIWHGLLGIVEGIITYSVITYIEKMRPDIMKNDWNQKSRLSRKYIAAITIIMLVSPVFAYMAEVVNYSEPLENSAEKLGVSENPLYSGILPDYTIPDLNEYAGTLISALFGTLLLLATGIYLLPDMISKRNEASKK